MGKKSFFKKKSSYHLNFWLKDQVKSLTFLKVFDAIFGNFRNFSDWSFFVTFFAYLNRSRRVVSKKVAIFNYKYKFKKKLKKSIS